MGDPGWCVNPQTGRQETAAVSQGATPIDRRCFEGGDATARQDTRGLIETRKYGAAIVGPLTLTLQNRMFLTVNSINMPRIPSTKLLLIQKSLDNTPLASRQPNCLHCWCNRLPYSLLQPLRLVPNDPQYSLWYVSSLLEGKSLFSS
jgi:hypothetical protein